MSELAQLLELVPFLRDTNPQVREIALSNLLGHTVKTSPYRGTLFYPSGLASGAPIKDAEGKARSPVWALKLLCRDNTIIAHDAFSALVNLSDAAQVQKECSDEDFLGFLVSYIVNPTSVLSSLASMLLSNLTSSVPLTTTLSLLLIPVLPLLPNPKASPPQLQTYYLPSSRSASSIPPPNLPLPTEEVTVEYLPPLGLLVEAFVQGAAAEQKAKDGGDDKAGARKGDCHFLATVISNLSVLPPIRQSLLAPAVEIPRHPKSELPSLPDSILSESLLSKLLIFTEHADTIRRGGVLSTLKHIALSAQTHPLLLASEETSLAVPHLHENKLPALPTPAYVRGVDVLPKILGPLMGGEEVDIDEMDALPVSLQFLPPDKKREVDPVLRLTCVETLLLLATTLSGREQLRARGTYTVIKLAHKAETDDKTIESMVRLVGLLQREEGPETKLEELGEDGTPTLPVRAEDNGVESEEEDGIVEV